MTREEIIEELNKKIPRDAVSTREGGGGKKLSYLETYYVIDRANAAFGNDNWSHELVELRLLPTEKPSYLAKVRITATIGDKKVVKEGIGYGSDKGAMNPHELAAKEAESDALKRAMMKFGMSMGLALYDKSQDNVEDAAPKATPTPKKNAFRPTEKPATPSTSAGTMRDLVRAGFRALSSAGKLDKAKFQEQYTNKNLDDLSDTEMHTVYTKFTADFPEVAAANR